MKEIELASLKLGLDGYGQIILTKGHIPPKKLEAVLEKIAPDHEDIPIVIVILNEVLIAMNEMEKSLDKILEDGEIN